MSNKTLSGSINLSLLQGSFIYTFKGTTATKQCICIPIEDAKLISGTKGVYLPIVMFENDPEKAQFGQTHSIKQSFTKEQRDAMGDAQTPYLGNMAEVKKMDVASQAAENQQNVMKDVDPDLPF